MLTRLVYFIPPYGNPVLCVCYSSGASFACPGGAPLFKHLKEFKNLPWLVMPALQTFVSKSPTHQLDIIVYIAVCIAVRYIGLVSMRDRMTSRCQLLGFKVFSHVQGGFNILLKLTPITPFHHLFGTETNRRSQCSLDSVQKLNLAKILNLNNISNAYYNQRLASILFLSVVL